MSIRTAACPVCHERVIIARTLTADNNVYCTACGNRFQPLPETSLTEATNHPDRAHAEAGSEAKPGQPVIGKGLGILLVGSVLFAGVCIALAIYLSGDRGRKAPGPEASSPRDRKRT